MDFGDPQLTDTARAIERELEAVHEELRASRNRPLDATLVAELTRLRFAATRLTRRLRLVSPTETASPALEQGGAALLESELRDASAEAERRGIALTLELDAIERLSRDRRVIDALASLVEDGIDQGASFLNLEVRGTEAGAEVRLTSDTSLQYASFGVLVLGSLVRKSQASLSVRVEAPSPGLFKISMDTQPGGYEHGAKRWTFPSPSSI